jgi:hypothetical protein
VGSAEPSHMSAVGHLQPFPSYQSHVRFNLERTWHRQASIIGDRALLINCEPLQECRPADFYAGLRPCSLLSKPWFSNACASFKQNATTTKRRAR